MKNRNIIRAFALILTLVMTLSLFVACDKSGDTTAPTETTKAVETTKAPETTEHTHDYGEALIFKII